MHRGVPEVISVGFLSTGALTASTGAGEGGRDLLEWRRVGSCLQPGCQWTGTGGSKATCHRDALHSGGAGRRQGTQPVLAGEGGKASWGAQRNRNGHGTILS